jgi:hypothetical protein
VSAVLTAATAGPACEAGIMSDPIHHHRRRETPMTKTAESVAHGSPDTAPNPVATGA